MLTDYHVHLRPDHSGPETGSYFNAKNVENYRLVAHEHGIEELGVSEHIHRFSQALNIWQHPFWAKEARDDLDAYCKFIREETDLRLGIEADFIFGCEDKIANLLEQYQWDYVLGSIHFLADCSVDQSDWDIWHKDNNPERVWRHYFETLGEAASCGLFDILSHPDLIKVWGDKRPYPDGDLRRFYELAMDGIAQSKIAIEVSTAGLRKPIGEIYPAREFLEMCLEAGCPIALSSDAHQAQHIGYRYDQALKMLSEIGVTELSIFDRRQHRLEPISF